MTIDFSDLTQTDTADLKVKHPKTGDETGFVITFAGPGHAQTVKQKTLAIGRGLKKARLGDALEDQSPEEVETQSVEYIVGRIVGWKGFVWKGEPKDFSPEFAHELLSNPQFDWLRNAANRFLLSEASFFGGSAKG